MELPPNDLTKAWFESIPDVAGPSPLPEEPKKGSIFTKKLIFILFGILVIVSLGGGAYLLLRTSSQSAKACLSPSDYAALTGSESQDKGYSPEGTFYTAFISFDSGTATYSRGTQTDDKVQLKKIADFYASHHAATSITLTIRADYLENDSVEAANNRISTLRDFLTQNGVDSTSIHTNQPTGIDSSSELEKNSEELTHATAYVSISSGGTCLEVK